MAFLVHKYGGISVSSMERINAVADLVVRHHRKGDDLIVVVSAMGGETDRLVELALGLTKVPEPREMDVLLASGEQASIALLSVALLHRGIRARSFLAGQIPIQTDRNHVKARIEKINSIRLVRLVREGIIPVIAGFQGVNEDGDITTLGRGGSDISAVAIAAAVDADECQIYTDVSGVYTTDPKIVDNASRIPRIDYEEMLEMASLGARVLHPRSVQLAHKYGVPLRVLSSFEDSPSTIIETKIDDMEQPLISAITYERDVAKLTVVGVPDVPDIALKILGPMSTASIVVDMIVQSIGAGRTTDFTFTVKRSDFQAARTILERLISDGDSLLSSDGAYPGEIQSDDRIAKVTAVGVGMRSHAGVGIKIFEALARESINIQMISTSEIKISVVIDEDDVELAVRALHDAFELGT